MPLPIFFFSDSLELHQTCKYTNNLYEEQGPKYLLSPDKNYVIE